MATMKKIVVCAGLMAALTLAACAGTPPPQQATTEPAQCSSRVGDCSNTRVISGEDYNEWRREHAHY